MDEQLLNQRAAFEIVNSIEIDAREIRTLNSLNAVNNVVRWRRQPRWLARRLLDHATGRTHQFNQLFEGQTADALRGLHDMLSDIRQTHAESDLIIAKTASKVVQIHGALKSFKSEVIDMLGEMQAQIAAVEFRVNALEARAGIDDAMLRLRNPELGPLTLDRLWIEFDGLWWSDFGAVVRRDPRGKPTQALIGKLQNEVAAVLRERCRPLIAGNLALPLQPLLDGVTRLDPDEHETRELLALDPGIDARPLTMALVNRSLGKGPDPRESQMVPRVATPSGLAERLFNETLRSTGE